MLLESSRRAAEWQKSVWREDRFGNSLSSGCSAVLVRRTCSRKFGAIYIIGPTGAHSSCRDSFQQLIKCSYSPESIGDARSGGRFSKTGSPCRTRFQIFGKYFVFCFAVRDIFSRLFDDFATSDPSKNLARILWIHFKGKMFATNYISLIKYFTEFVYLASSITITKTAEPPPPDLEWSG